MTLQPGIITMTAARYHEDPSDEPSLSAHIASLMVNATPLHAFHAHPRLNPAFERREKSQYDIGTISHSLILEGDDSRVHVVDAADWRRKEAQEQRDTARERGQIPVLERDWHHVQAMTAAVREQLAARNDELPLFTAGKAEQTLIWQEGGITCRARLDWLRDDFQAIDDLKTTRASANPLRWSRNTLWQIGADIQVVFYRRGIQQLTGIEPQFRYVLAESIPPYALSVVELDSSALELGRAKVERAITKWRECLQTGIWPGYSTGTYFAETPAYEELRWMETDAEAMSA